MSINISFFFYKNIGSIRNVYGHLALLRALRSSYRSYFTEKHFKSNFLSLYYFTAFFFFFFFFFFYSIVLTVS